MKRTTILLTNEVLDVVDRMESDEDIARALDAWAQRHGIGVGSLRSEASRLTVLLRLAAAYVREGALEESYRRMAGWYNAEGGR